MSRLLTKEQRENVFNTSIYLLTDRGYTEQVYKKLHILTKEEGGDILSVQIYKEGAGHPILNKRYKPVSYGLTNIENVKRNYDGREEYKAKNPPRKSGSALCAIAIREELKANFEGVKFSVKSETYSGGDSVRIEWTDGPTTAEVTKFTAKYQYGSFNGMEDIYEHTNSREDIPQAKYIFETRTKSEELHMAILNELKAEYGTYFDELAEYEQNRKVYKKFSELSLYTPPNKTDAKKTARPTAPSAEGQAGNISVIEYSEKAVAIVGEGTKKIKDELKKIGAKFNFRLSCGAGWIYPKSRINELTALLSSLSQQQTAQEDNTKGEPIEAETEAQAPQMLLIEAPKEEEPTHPDPMHPINICDPQSTQYKEAKQELKKEVEKMVNFFAETDLKIHSEITGSTRQIAEVQAVKIYDNLEDINSAVKRGEIISLCNLSNIVNNKTASHV